MENSCSKKQASDLRLGEQGKMTNPGNDYLVSLFELSGKVAVVTGGGGALMGTISRGLGRLGVRVAVLDVVPEMAQKVAD